ncbi:Uncharacterised protein [Mycobacteroides abscessus subsp. abscessus]|nr:Uncharacterised protein [Mycobacteroides abscessus subsp. abscessus]
MHPVGQDKDRRVVDVARSGFDQADSHIGIFGKSGGENTSGGSTARDHVVVGSHCAASVAMSLVLECDASTPMFRRPTVKYQSSPSPRMIPI